MVQCIFIYILCVCAELSIHFSDRFIIYTKTCFRDLILHFLVKCISLIYRYTAFYNEHNNTKTSYENMHCYKIERNFQFVYS